MLLFVVENFYILGMLVIVILVLLNIEGTRRGNSARDRLFFRGFLLVHRIVLNLAVADNNVIMTFLH